MENHDYLFTSESVSEGHPDKIADQISDAVLDAVLKDDPTGHVACETLVTTGMVVVSGEITTDTYVDVTSIARDTIARIGYTRAKYGFDAYTCGVITSIHEQSPDIAQGVRSALEFRTDPSDGDILDSQGLRLFLMSNAAYIEVIGPLELREHVRDQLLKAVALYR